MVRIDGRRGATVLGLVLAMACSDDGGGAGGAIDGGAGGAVAVGEYGAGGAGTGVAVAGGATGGAQGEGGGPAGGGEAGCPGVPRLAQPGDGCMSDEDCDEGGACVTAPGEDQARCRQLCVPGRCRATCAANEECLAIADERTGEPQRFDDGRSKGACLDRPAGTAGPYASCAAERCRPGLACVAFGDEAVGATCAPRCGEDGACPAPDGFEADCILLLRGNEDTTHCAILCDDAEASSDCSDGMTCRQGATASFCIR